MFSDWAFAQRGYGVLVIQTDGTVILVEFNEFLRRIANQSVQAEDFVISAVFTDGKRRRVGDLRLFGMVLSGQVATEKLPIRSENGILAEGAQARAVLHSWEGTSDRNAETLLRPASAPEIETADLLRPVSSSASSIPPEQLPRPAEPLPE